MMGQHPTRLREIDAPPPDEGAIIDARFKIIGHKRRVVRMLWRGLVTIFWAAVIGFAIPPVWIAFEYARDFFR